MQALYECGLHSIRHCTNAGCTGWDMPLHCCTTAKARMRTAGIATGSTHPKNQFAVGAGSAGSVEQEGFAGEASKACFLL